MAAAGIWIKALRLPFLTATFVPVALGTIIAWHETGAFNGVHLVLATAGVSLIHLGANLSNDFFDFKSENDLINTGFNAFSGGSRVIADGQLSPGEVFSAAALCYGTGALVGLLLAWFNGSILLGALIIAGVLAGYFYTAPPLKFAYRSTGELVNVLAFGPLIVAIACLAQGAAPSPAAIAASMFPGLLLGLLLLINEFPDYEADIGAAKRTLVVRLGTLQALNLHHAGLAAVFLLVPLTVAIGSLPPTVLITLFTLPLAVLIVRQTRDHLHEACMPASANALCYQLHFVFGLFLCTGILAGTLI
ncbi:MAG: prenyltransferase [Methanomicrobiaceae archaeon]|nr:prenyltransferase [Methanomicrobiaceae archaeon]